MIKALYENLGVVAPACKDVKISRQTHYRWMREDEEYKERVEEVGEEAIDFAESCLYKQIKEGNTTATIFYLKTKAKHRGYIEKTEVENTHSFKKDISGLFDDIK